MSGELPSVTIFADGSSPLNREGSGPGGWATILRGGGRERELSGGAEETTNNRMELVAVLEGLRALRRPCLVTIVADSRYVLDGIERWVPEWIERGYRPPKKNADLWLLVLEAARRHTIAVGHVHGHTGHPENERCDELAGRESAAVGSALLLLARDWEEVTSGPVHPTVENRRDRAI